MGRKLILDTGVLIGIERGRISLSAFADDDDLALAAISASELYTGVEFGDEANRLTRRQHVDAVFQVIPVEHYTLRTAEVHAALRAHTKRAGRPRGVFDLIIAATARATDRILVTTDKSADFGELPGVDCILLQS